LRFPEDRKFENSGELCVVTKARAEAGDRFGKKIKIKRLWCAVPEKEKAVADVFLRNC